MFKIDENHCSLAFPSVTGGIDSSNVISSETVLDDASICRAFSSFLDNVVFKDIFDAGEHKLSTSSLFASLLINSGIGGLECVTEDISCKKKFVKHS